MGHIECGQGGNKQAKRLLFETFRLARKKLFANYTQITIRPHSSMDRATVSGTVNLGSTPNGGAFRGSAKGAEIF